MTIMKSNVLFLVSSVFCLLVLYAFFYQIQVLGPDFISYQIGTSGGFKLWMLREPIAWWLILFFTENSFSLLVGCLILNFFIVFAMKSLVKEFYITNVGTKNLKVLFLILPIFLILNPFTLLLSLSALRQGIGLVFFIYFLWSIRKSYLLASTFALASILSHTSFLIFVVAVLIFHILDRVPVKYLFPVFVISSGVFFNIFIPKATLVTNSNLVLYMASHVGLILFIFLIGIPSLTRLILALISVPFAFFLDLSYFDRLSLIPTLICWPIVLAVLFSRINMKGTVAIPILLAGSVFFLLISGFEKGWDV